MLLSLSSVAYAQTTNDVAHYPLYKKISDSATLLRMAEYLGNGETITMWETLLYGSSGTVVLVKSKGDTPNVKEVKLKKDQQLAKGEVIVSALYRGAVYVVYQYYSRDEEELQLWLAQINTETLAVDSDEKLMAVGSYSKAQKEIGFYNAAFSKDNSQLVVFGVSGSKDGKQSAAYLQRYNLADKSGWTSDIRFDQSYSVIPALSELTPLSNNGAAITFRVVFPSNKRRVFKGVEYVAPHEYIAMVFDGEGKQSFSQVLEVENHLVSEVSLIEAKPGFVTVAGWVTESGSLSFDATYGSTGAFSTVISLTDYAMKPFSVLEFGRDLLGKNRDTPLSSINNVQGYLSLTTLGRERASDGSAYIMAEERYGWSQGDYTAYRGEDAVVAKVSPEGSLEWVAKLATRSSAYGEKAAFMHNDRLHVVFEDFTSNESILDGGFANLGKDKESVLAIGSFSSDGKPSKKHVYNYGNDKKRAYYGWFVGLVDGGIAQITANQGLHYLEYVKLP